MSIGSIPYSSRSLFSPSSHQCMLLIQERLTHATNMHSGSIQNFFTFTLNCNFMIHHSTISPDHFSHPSSSSSLHHNIITASSCPQVFHNLNPLLAWPSTFYSVSPSVCPVDSPTNSLHLYPSLSPFPFPPLPLLHPPPQQAQASSSHSSVLAS